MLFIYSLSANAFLHFVLEEDFYFIPLIGNFQKNF